MLLRTPAASYSSAHLGGVLWFAARCLPLWWAYAVLMSTSLAFVTLVRERDRGKLRAVGSALLLVNGVVTGFVSRTGRTAIRQATSGPSRFASRVDCDRVYPVPLHSAGRSPRQRPEPRYPFQRNFHARRRVRARRRRRVRPSPHVEARRHGKRTGRADADLSCSARQVPRSVALGADSPRLRG